METRKTIAAKITENRIEKGFRKTDLAKKMGVSDQYITNIESGNENLTVDTLIKLAKGLDMKVEVRFAQK